MAFNLHLIRIFNTVVESGSFSQAGKNLYISQPAISQAMQDLEQQLELSLFIRFGRRIKLTPAGELLYSYTKQIQATERAAELALEQIRGLRSGQLAIGASSTIGIYLLPRILGVFHQRYPGIRLLLDVGNTAPITERLLNATLDTAFVEGPVTHPQIIPQLWHEDSLVVIAKPTHPLADHQPIELSRLTQEAFVMREPGSGMRDIIDSTLHTLGFERKIALELGSTEAVKQAAMAGLGLAIIPASTITSELALGKLVILDVPELVIRRQLKQLSVIGRPASPALAAFYALLESENISVDGS